MRSDVTFRTSIGKPLCSVSRVEFVLFATIPTAGTKPQFLNPLIDAMGLPRENIIVVVTRPNLELPEGCTVVEDLGPINIQRWWTRGIEEARARGATKVAVCNDDLVIGASTMHDLAAALDRTGAAIASPHRADKRPGLHRGRLVPYSPVLWGCLWMLNISSGLMPDTNYRWWYGDNDLDIRARRDFRGIASVVTEFEHKDAGGHTSTSPELQALATADQLRYESEYHRLIWLSHQYQRLSSVPRRLIRGTGRLHE